METSPDTASSNDDNGTTPSSSSPPSESPPESSAQSPPPPSASPPPTVESPPSPPPPSTTPKASSPVPSTTNTPSQSPPPPSITDLPAVSNHTSPEIMFAPPTQSPPSPSGRLPRPSPSRDSPSEKPSGGSSGNNNNDSDSSSLNVIIVGGVAVAGLLLLAFVIICLLCKKKKKRHHYYMDTRRPPKGSDPYYNGNNQWNSPKPKDHIVKLHPPPGIMGTPLAGGGGGWAPSNLGYSNGEFGSGFVGQQALTPASPNMGGYGGFSKSQFTYEELAAATSGFSQDNLLGQGGFGYVHKGILTDGKVVAVKSLKSGSGQGEREFQAEVEIISRVHHRHLVSLVGYCMAEEQRLLVYEYVSNKTLEFHLHGKGRPPMDWGTKLKIALGSAKGLAYLHEDCHPRIIHRDIKAANILLDDNFEAMVADFGLAKLSSDNHTHVSTRVMGTFGYMAPEYASSGKLTEKSDVFSFGVMLLELITGKRPVDPTNKFMEDSLVDWARPLLAKALEEGTYDDLLDVPLQGNVVPSELRRLVACAAASIRHSAKRRPRMSQIVRALDGDSSLEDLNNGNKPGQTATFSTNAGVESYDTGAYNADIMKFRKMVMPSQEFNSSDYGGTSEYGLNPSSSSSDSRESGHSGGRG